jgi:hypothetical protein
VIASNAATFESAVLLAVEGLASNAQVCARHWSPEMLVNRAVEIAEALMQRLEKGRPLESDTVPDREMQARMVMRLIASYDAPVLTYDQLARPRASGILAPDESLKQIKELAQKYLETCEE